MKRGISAAFWTTAIAVAACVASAGEIDVARSALRDGLWDVARAHAVKTEGETARLVELEALGGENRWKDVLSKLAEWGEPSDEAFACWRAAALFRTGAKAAAVKALEVDLSSPVARAFATRLKAQAAADAGDAAGALEILSKDPPPDAETRLLLADLQARTGDRTSAEASWRAVAALTNAPEECVAAALANLGDAAALTNFAARARSADARRLALQRAGVVFLKDDATFALGAKLVAATVRDAPDASGSRAAHLALADARLRRGEWVEALRAYGLAAETWPMCSEDAEVASGCGWALSRLGRHEEAAEAFARAEAAFSNAVSKADAAAKVGDALMASGRREEALARWRAALAKYPGTPAAARIGDVVRRRELEAQGRAYYRDYRFADAAKAFAQLASEEPDRKPRYDFFLVLCLFGQGLDEAAEKRARALSDGCPDADVRADASLWLAKNAYNAGRWKESESLFSAYADMRPAATDAADALVWSARAAFAAGAYDRAVQCVARLAARYPESSARTAGLLVQGEALLELVRFDEAVLVFERAAAVPGATEAERRRAQVLRADALFALGADNPAHYETALAAYRAIRQGETPDPTQALELSFKIARTLEKLRRMDEAVDQYYAQVVLAYLEGRRKGVRYGDAARAAFSRAALWLAEEYESRGGLRQTERVLELLSTSDVPAAEEARRRLARLQAKGRF